MKKILIFSGNHARHIYVNKLFLEYDFEISLILMKREDLTPKIPNNLIENDRKIFEKHFFERAIREEDEFGLFNSNDQIKKIFDKCQILECDSELLNSESVKVFVENFSPDFVFIFGTNIIKNPVSSILPENTINLHLGLSPWYRGSATLFWPFYNLEPQFAGATFHKILNEPDAGDILHQCVPSLTKGQKIHDVGVNTVVKAKMELNKIINYALEGRELLFNKQKSSGKNYLTSDFRPEHLRLIYNEFDNKIVDYYLYNKKIMKNPNLIKLF